MSLKNYNIIQQIKFTMKYFLEFMVQHYIKECANLFKIVGQFYPCIFGFWFGESIVQSIYCRP